MGLLERLPTPIKAIIAAPGRVIKVASITLAVILALAVVGAFALPPYLKPLVEKELSTTLGRKVTIGEMGVNLLNLSATVKDFKLYDPNQQTTTLQVGKLYANVSLASLWRGAPVVKQIQLEQPIVHLARLNSDRFNVSDIIDKFASAPAKPKSDDKPAQFSLNNISVDGGEIYLADEVTHTKHEIKALHIGVPFISNLPYAADIFTEPALSANINGAPFAIHGKTLPFSKDYQTALNIDLDGFDLTKILPFVPLPFAAKINSALLDSRLTVQFAQEAKAQRLKLGGTASLRKVDIQETKVSGDAAQFLAFDALNITLDGMEPLQQQYLIKSLELNAPKVHIAHLADGRFNFQRALQSTAPPKHAPAPSPTKPAKANTLPLRVALGHVQINHGQVVYDDLTLHPTPFHYKVQQLDVSLDQLDTATDKAANYRLQAETDHHETVHHEGKLNLAKNDVAGTIQFKDFQPQQAQAYFANAFKGNLGTTKIDAELPYHVNWKNEVLVTLANANVRVHEIQLFLPKSATSKAANFSAKEFSVQALNFDLQKQQVEVGKAALVQPVSSVVRDAQGKINLLSVLPDTPTKVAPAKPAAAHSKARPWQVLVHHAGIEGASLDFSDAVVAVQNSGKPAVQHIRGGNFSVDNFHWPMVANSAPFNVALALQHNGAGRIQANGNVKLIPAVTTKLAIDISKLDIAAAQPYFTQYINAKLSQGQLNTKGALNLILPASTANQSAPQVSYEGNASVTNLKTQDKVNKDEFVRWSALSLNQINFKQNSPANAPMNIGIGKIALNDFFARVIVNKNGRLNLQDVAAKPTPISPNGAPVSLTQAEPTASASSVQTASAVTTANVPAATPASNPVATAPAPIIRLGGITLHRGQINITDNFIQPNYRANLRSLEGVISKVASDDPNPADVNVTAKLDDLAPISITGQVNPLSQDLFLKLQAAAKGIELTRFTAYSAKYTGYPIVKGKLNIDLQYHVEQGKLEAQNNVFIDQFTFGEKVDSPSATSLPVRLAVSLLKNRNGEIDVHLPVTGSLSDPKFSIGGLIWQVIVNLVSKAVTSPFSLIAAGMGTEDMGYIDFPAGESTLNPAALKRLDGVARVLTDKPDLKLDIIGRIDPAQDLAGLQQAYVTRKMKLIKRSQLGNGHVNDALDAITINASERPALLEKAYKAETFAKPKNFIGLAKSLPAEEMEKLMREHAPTDNATYQQLAERRAQQIKKYLLEHGKVPDARVFILAPQKSEDRPDPKVNTARVDLSLQ